MMIIDIPDISIGIPRHGYALLSDFYTQLINENVTTIGKALLKAQQNNLSNTKIRYTLLGDPSLRNPYLK